MGHIVACEYFSLVDQCLALCIPVEMRRIDSVKLEMMPCSEAPIHGARSTLISAGLGELWPLVVRHLHLSPGRFRSIYFGSDDSDPSRQVHSTQIEVF